jgi:hypothetical protein
MLSRLPSCADGIPVRIAFPSGIQRLPRRSLLPQPVLNGSLVETSHSATNPDCRCRGLCGVGHASFRENRVELSSPAAAANQLPDPPSRLGTRMSAMFTEAAP